MSFEFTSLITGSISQVTFDQPEERRNVLELVFVELEEEEGAE